MSSQLYPNEILAAIERHKSKNDPHGDGAFKITYENIRSGKKNSQFMNFLVAKKVGKSEEFVPAKLVFRNMQTRAKIHPYEDREYGIQIQFRKSSFYNRPVKKNGKTVRTEVEKYGEAKLAMVEAFKRKMQFLLDKKIVKRKQKNLSMCGVQYGPVSDESQKFDDPIIRVNLKYERDGANKPKPNAMPLINIYDVNHTQDPRPKRGIPYMLTKDVKDEQGNKKYDISAKGIHEYLKGRSSVSGVDNCSSISMTGLGISLGSEFEFLIVKPSKGFRATANDTFDQDDFTDMESAHDTFEDSEEDSSETPEKNGNEDEFRDETEGLDDDLDE